jgi:hypothetical protein
LSVLDARSLSPVFGGHNLRCMSTQPSTQARRSLPFPFAVTGVAIGLASLLGNMVWNCSTCGWDLDGVPWYQALLVAAVPFIIAPLGATLVGLRALVLRTRNSAIEFLLATLGLALPWAYFLIGSRG